LDGFPVGQNVNKHTVLAMAKNQNTLQRLPNTDEYHSNTT